MKLIGIAKMQLCKDVVPCGFLLPLIERQEKQYFLSNKQLPEFNLNNFWILQKPIFINQQDYNVFYYQKENRLNELFDFINPEKIEIKQQNDFNFILYSSQIFNKIKLNYIMNKLRQLCNQNINNISQLLFYAKIFLFFSYQTSLEDLHEGAFYFCRAFKEIGWSKDQIIQWLNNFKEKDRHFNIEFIIKKVYK